MMYGSDYPLVPFDRVRRELPDCGISEAAMPWFTVNNAARVFWGDSDEQ
jgi:predicted TIM-barrel fold metal-dependent hydrolase